MFKGASIAEVLIVYLSSLILGWIVVALFQDFFTLEREILGYNYIFPIFFYFSPILIILGAKRDFKNYGITNDNWQFGVDIAMSIFLFALIPYLLGILIINFLGWGILEPFGALIITGLWIVTLFLVLESIKKRDINKQISSRKSRNNLITILILLLVPILLGIILNKFSGKLVSLILWQFFVSGFGEEFKYRGYFQSTINREFGRPYRIRGIQFGLGLIISSILFSISHILNPFNPFIGNFELTIWWGTFSLVAGFVFGLLREKTESILAPAIFHGLPDAVGEAIGMIFGLL